ncbi:hypothetical protein E4U21_005728 [Claviceps maximensis]|nr:hypothetical protein E4U21_005728 [Claviceps maximensis]
MDINDTVSEMSPPSTTWTISPSTTWLFMQTSPAAFGFASLVTCLAVFLVYLAYTPQVDALAPKFTTDKDLFIGSQGYYTRRWSFWRDSVARSNTGQFSFWLGKVHVVGVSGEAGRKVFLDNQHLDRVKAAPMHGIGPEIVPPIHAIWQPNFNKGHSYFQRRVLDLMKTEHLGARLYTTTRGARTTFCALAEKERERNLRKGANSGTMVMMTDPIDACFRLILSQSVRMMCCDELAETKELFERYVANAIALQHLSSGPAFGLPWLPSLAHNKRRFYRHRQQSLLTPLVQRRMRESGSGTADALQILIDSGDSADYIITFLINILFISVANAGKLAGVLLNLICQHPSWQDRVLGEIMAATSRYETPPSTLGTESTTLVDRLDAMPLDVWETSFPFLDQLIREAIRMHVSFPMTRLNTSSRAILIPGTGQVIPSGSFVAYHTNDVHLNDKLYPNPLRFDPLRFAAGAEVSKTESYSYLGWGNGRHRCVGQRWAKLQLTINLVYAVAMYKWSSCDADGNSIPTMEHTLDRDTHGNDLAKGVFYYPEHKTPSTPN